jgi:hypothetical protein
LVATRVVGATIRQAIQIADWLASRFLETDRVKAPFD